MLEGWALHTARYVPQGKFRIFGDASCQQSRGAANGGGLMRIPERLPSPR